MSDFEQIDQLRERLSDLEHRPITIENRATIQVARESLENEITRIGQRLSRRNYWKPSFVRIERCA